MGSELSKVRSATHLTYDDFLKQAKCYVCSACSHLSVSIFFYHFLIFLLFLTNCYSLTFILYSDN